MKIHFLGTCAGTEPMMGRQHMSFVIETRGALYWFDAGEGCSRTAHIKGLDLLSVKAVVISHPHMDHTGGLANLIWNISAISANYGLPHKFGELLLFVPLKNVWSGAETLLDADGASYKRRLSVVPCLMTDGVLFDDGAVKITAYHNMHIRRAEGEPWRSFSFRIEAEGKAIVYSGDIRELQELDSAIGEGCDCAITETGHFKIDAVHAYYAEKNVGCVYFSHNGREILGDPEGSREKVAALFGRRGVIAEDCMTVDV